MAQPQLPFSGAEQETLKQMAAGSLRRQYRLEEGDVRSRDYIPGQQGFRMHPQGMEINKLTIRLNAGAPTGGDSGDVVLDTTNSRLYVKVGATWKYAALT